MRLIVYVCVCEREICRYHKIDLCNLQMIKLTQCSKYETERGMDKLLCINVCK